MHDSEKVYPALRFDVAVSFAGEDRSLVEEIVSLLRDRGIRVFYDADMKAELWGKDLIEYFTDIYQNHARYAVMFVSRHYAEKMWTRQERRSILARALNQQSEYALPVRLDDTELDGLLPTVGYLDARVEGAQGIAGAVARKLGTNASEPNEWTSGTPRTGTQIQALLAMRPPGWEYLYYGALLAQGRDRLEPRFLDMEISYAPQRRVLDGHQSFDFLKSVPLRYSGLANSFESVLKREAQEQAFGLPGNPGNAARIYHLADRFVSIYEGFLEMHEDILGSVMPHEFKRARNYIARGAHRPVQSIRQFITEFATELDTFPQRLSDGEDIILTMTLKLDIEDGLIKNFIKELRRAHKKHRY